MLSGLLRGTEIQADPTPKACDPAMTKLLFVPCFRGGSCQDHVLARDPRKHATRRFIGGIVHPIMSYFSAPNLFAQERRAKRLGQKNPPIKRVVAFFGLERAGRHSR